MTWFSEFAFPMRGAWRDTNDQKWCNQKLIARGPEYSITCVGQGITCYAFAGGQVPYIDLLTLREWIDALCCFYNSKRWSPRARAKTSS